MIPVVPALIPSSDTDVRETLSRLSFSHEIHLDMVDGKFVPNFSWPYDPEGNLADVKDCTDKFSLEVDLMVEDPLSMAVECITAGADMLIFHLETITLENFKNFHEFTHVTTGISAHGDTSIDTLLEYAQHADYVQLMGIREVGAMKQPFDEEVFKKIKAVKTAFPEKTISIDGSVNKDTIVRLKEAGADRFIVGSAITLQEDPQAAHAELCSLIN